MRRRTSPRALFAVGSTLAIGLAIVALAATLLVSRARWADETLQTLEPRHARLLGLHGHREAFAEALDRTSAMLDEAAYPPALPPGRVGADMQQKLRAASESAGFAVVSSRIGTVTEHDGFEEVPLSLRLEGSLVHLEAMLRALPELRPRVHLRSLSVTAVGRRAAERELRVDLVVAAARLAS